MTIDGSKTYWEQSDVYHQLIESLKGVFHGHSNDVGAHSPSVVEDGANGNARLDRAIRSVVAGSGVILLLVAPGWGKACDKGYERIKGIPGCTATGVPSSDPVKVDQSQWIIKDENGKDLVPTKDKMPSYQREGVKAVDAPNMTEPDRKWDESVKKELDSVGKRAK